MHEFLYNGCSIKEYLLKLSENSNKEFARTLNPGVENVLGLRLPELRKLAAGIAESDWKAYLSCASTFYMEERMLQGMVLGYIKPDDDIENYLTYVTRFVKIINSWSVCDSFKFAGGKKYITRHAGRLWEYVKAYMCADGEYEIRFGVVMAMKYFIDDVHIDEYLSLLDNIKNDGYYVKMAVAWAVSSCFVKYPDKTIDFILHSSLDNFTYNKSIQKIIESFRVGEDMKTKLRAMRRK